jgi:hypothetical protein
MNTRNHILEPVFPGKMTFGSTSFHESRDPPELEGLHFSSDTDPSEL